MTKYSSEQLKYLLPSVAYYFVTGPWRIMWVRFGYDPRSEPSAIKYQSLDYRVRTVGKIMNSVSRLLLCYRTLWVMIQETTQSHQCLTCYVSGGLKSKVSAKRNYANYLLPYKSSPSCRPKVPIITKQNLKMETPIEKETEESQRDLKYVFYPGVPPPSRQMFYQVMMRQEI